MAWAIPRSVVPPAASATLAAQKPPLALDAVWRAYETLDRSRVRGGPAKVLTDVVSLVRFALHQDEVLAPFPAAARARFEDWVARMETTGREFTPEQRAWLEAVVEHLAANLEIEADDFEYPPFAQRGGLGAAYRVFGQELKAVLDEVTVMVAA
jgi:type I restriction enzyme, R subunit